MEILCLAAYIRILTSCAIKSDRKFDPFCEKVMLSICEEGAIVFTFDAEDGNTVYYDYTNFRKIHSGRQNLPSGVTKMARGKDPHAIKRYFHRAIVPALDEARKRHAVLALKTLILKDSSIVDTTELGTLASLTKKELKNKNEFILEEFLTDIFVYTVLKTDNMSCQDFLKTIKKDYYKNFDLMVDSIKLYDIGRVAVSPAISLTSSENGFSDVFVQVESAELNLSDDHDLQIFCLQFEDTKFDYNGLWKYLVKNIGNYVYSRAAMERYKDPENMVALAYDAIGHVKKLIDDGKVPGGHELGEMLLYLFLEQVLHASKFMSSIELSTSGGVYSSESSGIFILTDKSGVAASKLILGTSTIIGDLKGAVDAAFSKVEDLEKRKDTERRFVETSILAQTFTPEVSKQLENIIIPKRNGKKKPSTAFGVFLGYSLPDVSVKGQTIEQYQKAVMDQLRKDIAATTGYIDEQIDKHQLDKYSIYIYVLPFSNAEDDQKEIMDRLLQRGGGPA